MVGSRFSKKVYQCSWPIKRRHGDVLFLRVISTDFKDSITGHARLNEYGVMSCHGQHQSE